MSKESRTRDMEIKNKLTVTRGEEGGGITGQRRGRGSQETCIKDPRTKRVECGRWGWIEQERVMGDNGDNCN